MSSLPGHVTCQRGREKFATVWLHHPFQEQLERHIHPKRTNPTATVDEIRDAITRKIVRTACYPCCAVIPRTTRTIPVGDLDTWGVKVLDSRENFELQTAIMFAACTAWAALAFPVNQAESMAHVDSNLLMSRQNSMLGHMGQWPTFPAFKHFSRRRKSLIPSTTVSTNDCNTQLFSEISMAFMSPP